MSKSLRSPITTNRGPPRRVGDSEACRTATTANACLATTSMGCPGYMADWMQDPSRGGGGALIDEGSHAFDLLHWLVGDVEAVCCATTNIAKPAIAVEDSAMTLVRFEGGALGSLSTLWSLNI